ncbi:MAG: alpha-1,2-fucosyltransferase [Bacteroidota bacterium]
MVFLFEKFGNLSNNLFQHLHFNAFCKEHQIEFLNLTNPQLLSENTNVKLIDKLVFKLRKFLTKTKVISLIVFDEHTQISAAEELMKSKSTLFCAGWNYRCFNLTQKYRSYFASLYLDKINPKLNDLLSSDLINIAIHIRRGDYKEWENGKYYYEDETYLKAIEKMSQLINAPFRVLLFTNDDHLNNNLYLNSHSNTYFSKQDVKSDHYLMSRCDYIIGPPSSFSGWASYIGNTKLFHLKDKSCDFTLDDFEVCNG